MAVCAREGGCRRYHGRVEVVWGRMKFSIGAGNARWFEGFPSDVDGKASAGCCSGESAGSAAWSISGDVDGLDRAVFEWWTKKAVVRVLGKSSVHRLKICGAVRFCAAGLFMSRIMLSASAGSGPPSCNTPSTVQLRHARPSLVECSFIPIQSRPLLLFIRRDVHFPLFSSWEATKTAATVALSTRLNIASRVGKLTLRGCSAHIMAADPASHTTC
jgi:hypothetical protein